MSKSTHLRKADVIIPIVIGSYATIREDKQTYDWMIIVRSAHEPFLDLSAYLSSVEFQLHPSFPQPKRLVKNAPFALKEQGWGEFPITVKLNFVQECKSISTVHFLKLFSEQHVTVHEKYDQLCFHNISEAPKQYLTWNLESVDEYIQRAFQPTHEEIPKLEAEAVARIEQEISKQQNVLAGLLHDMQEAEKLYLQRKLKQIRLET